MLWSVQSPPGIALIGAGHENGAFSTPARALVPAKDAGALSAEGAPLGAIAARF